MAAQNVELDNRIYAVKMTPGLPQDLRTKVHQADVAYIQNRDGEAASLIGEVEQACRDLGITIMTFNF